MSKQKEPDMKRKTILVAFIALIVGVSALYAQNNATLKSGVYRFSGIQGAAMVIVQGTNTTTRKNIIVRGIDGDVVMRGTATIRGSRVSVDYGSDGFETWTIVDQETFTDDNYENTWRWVRNYKNEDL
jgi:hypothetical protein